MGKLATCPNCSTEYADTNWIGTKQVQHRPGDQFICRQCIGLLVYNSDMSLRLVPESEIAHMGMRQRQFLDQMRAAAIQARARRAEH